VFCVYCVIIVFFSVNCVICVFLQYFDTVGWALRPVKNRRPYNLYCVGGDVKRLNPAQSINQSAPALDDSDSGNDVHFTLCDQQQLLSLALQTA